MQQGVPALDLGVLYRDHHRMVRRRVRRMVGDELADELVQQAFAQALDRQETYRGEASPVAWLYQIATRVCLHHLRDGKRRAALLAAHGPPAWCRPESPSTAEATAFLGQLWGRLPAELAEIGTYHYLDGLTQTEIAELLGCSRRTVGHRLEALRARVRKDAEPTGRLHAAPSL